MSRDSDLWYSHRQWIASRRIPSFRKSSRKNLAAIGAAVLRSISRRARSSDGVRFIRALRAIVGKRLTYEHLTGNAPALATT